MVLLTAIWLVVRQLGSHLHNRSHYSGQILGTGIRVGRDRISMISVTEGLNHVKFGLLLTYGNPLTAHSVIVEVALVFGRRREDATANRSLLLYASTDDPHL
jgi:hypothetical protein